MLYRDSLTLNCLIALNNSSSSYYYYYYYYFLFIFLFTLFILTGKNFRTNSIQEFVKIETWFLPINLFDTFTEVDMFTYFYLFTRFIIEVSNNEQRKESNRICKTVLTLLTITLCLRDRHFFTRGQLKFKRIFLCSIVTLILKK